MPFGGTVTIDNVESGQTAAALGGTTCHVDFIIQPKGATFAEAIDEWRAKANGKQLIDMGYHMAVTDLHDGGTLEELASLPDQGITSYKLFMAYKGALMVDDETLFRTMEVAAETGALVMVHAENGDVIDVLVKQALEAGHTEPLYHALTRPPEAEGEATNRAIQLARLAELLATSPAKLFGLYPRQGTIAVGSDADIVIFDPEKRVTITAATQYSKSDYNLFEGTEVTGSPETVLLRGHVLVENGELVAQPGIGQYVARAKFGSELKSRRVEPAPAAS